MKYKHRFFNRLGFTVAELLVVVAIIGILVAISVPIFSAEREKARRAVDMDHARQIKTALVLAYSNEEIVVPEKKNQNGYGAWVMLCRGSNQYAPEWYHTKPLKNGMWCGANKDVVVNGNPAVNDATYNDDVEKILKDAGLDMQAFRTYSSGDAKGWDWIIIQVGYNEKGEFITRMYSGYKDQNGAAGRTHDTNIEKLIYKQ